MANEKHVALLNQGVKVWNNWREENPDVNPDLSCANLNWAELSGADLSGADLRGADLRVVNLNWADLRDADLSRANLRQARLHVANLRVCEFLRHGPELTWRVGLRTVADDSSRRIARCWMGDLATGEV